MQGILIINKCKIIYLQASMNFEELPFTILWRRALLQHYFIAHVTYHASDTEFVKTFLHLSYNKKCFEENGRSNSTQFFTEVLHDQPWCWARKGESKAAVERLEFI